MRNLLLHSLIWTLGLLSLAQAQEFTAYVNKRNPAVTEAFQISFTVENGRASNLQYPNFSDFQVLRGPYTSQRTEIVNGKVSQTITYSFYLRPKKTGTFTIGSATATVDGKSMKTEPITIKVDQASGNANPQAGGSNRQSGNQGQQNASIDEQLKDLIFLRAYVNKSSVYVGEPVTISYKLFQHDRLSTYELNAEDLPKYEGFWVENMKLPDASRRPQRETMGGVSFVTNLIKRDLLIPQKSGKLDIGAMTTSIVVNVPTQQGSPFSLFERYQRHQYFFANAPLTIEVKPLPTAGKPADFNGLIGEFEMDTEMAPKELDAGEALTFTLKVVGKGNLKDLREPQLNFPPDFEVFDPSIKENISVSGGTLVGSKTFEYPIVPRNPGEYKLPVFTLSYFDVNRRRYQTLSSEQYVLKVGGEAQGAPQGLAGAVNRDDLELIGQDIRYLQTRDFNLQKEGETFFGSVGFWTLYLLPFLLFGGLLVWKNRQDKLAGDQAGVRRRKADKMARKRLSQAEKHLQAGEEKAFYDEITRALWGYLGDKLTLGQSELTRERVSRVLAERGLPAEPIEQLKQLLDTCEMALFAPAAAPGGMPGTYEKARTLITSLDDQL